MNVSCLIKAGAICCTNAYESTRTLLGLYLVVNKVPGTTPLRSEPLPSNQPSHNSCGRLQIAALTCDFHFCTWCCLIGGHKAIKSIILRGLKPSLMTPPTCIYVFTQRINCASVSMQAETLWNSMTVSHKFVVKVFFLDHPLLHHQTKPNHSGIRPAECAMCFIVWAHRVCWGGVCLWCLTDCESGLFLNWTLRYQGV